MDDGKDLHQQDNAVLACLLETGHDFANATIRIELDDVSSGDPLTEHNAAITFICAIGNVWKSRLSCLRVSHTSLF